MGSEQFMTSPLMPLDEIRSILGLSKNHAKSVMKKYGVEHDGSPEMRYPFDEAQNAVLKHQTVVSKEEKRRVQISNRRAQKRYLSNDFLLTTTQMGRDELRRFRELVGSEALKLGEEEFLSAWVNGDYATAAENAKVSRMTLRQFAKAMGTDIYAIKDAIRLNIISEPQEGFFPVELLTNSSLAHYLESRQGLFETGVENLRDESFERVLTPRLRLPHRASPLRYVAFHLGPTNSGKTYNALEDLAREFQKSLDAGESKRFIYCGPLRMLAYEVYLKMVARFGEQAVGFVTGEETINPEAPIIASTVEMAPTSGEMIILDEAHWVLDEDRGHYWSKILMSGDFQKMHVIAAQEAYEGLRQLVEDAETIEVETFKRRTRISFDGGMRAAQIPDRTAVVCFTRNDVFHVYEVLRRQGKKVGVLYGALPVEVRKKQIQKYEDGEYEILVTTNVIGHGINLPIDNLVFAGTEKFDGKAVRPIPLFEAGQIAGRAGRSGLSEQGRVTYLDAEEYFAPDSVLVRKGVGVAAGWEDSGLQVDAVFVAPKFDDLGITDSEPHLLIAAYEKWSQLVRENSEHLPSPLPMMHSNAIATAQYLGTSLEGTTANMGRRAWTMPSSTLWLLCSGPFDIRNGVLPFAAEWLSTKDKHSAKMTQRAFSTLASAHSEMSLEAIEARYKSLFEFKMLAVMFAKDGMMDDLRVEAIHDQEAKLIQLIQEKIDNLGKTANAK